MPKDFGAGQLIETVAFDKRAVVDDGFGNQIAGDWQEQFQARAEFIQLRASETVMAGRLESHGAILIRVRVSENTDRLETDWQARDVKRGTAFNIREIHKEVTRTLYEILAESNVATG